MKKDLGQRRQLILLSCSLLSFFIGLGNTIKGGINSELSVHSNVEAATFVCFLGALIFLGMFDLVHYLRFGPRKEMGVPTWREGLLAANRYELLGGFLGFISLNLQTFAIYYLGASLMKVLLCTTEVLTSVTMDMAGGVYSGKGITLPMLIAGAVFLSLMGAGIIMYEDWDSPRLNVSSEIKWLACIAPLISGSLRPVQSRVNTSLSVTLKSKIRAAEWSCGSGSSFLFVATLVNFATVPGSWDLMLETMQDSSDWWMFFGGIFSSACVSGAIALPPLITRGSYYICLTSGQLTMALYLDSIGAFTFEQKDATDTRIIGTLLTISGAVMSRLPFMLDTKKVNALEKV